MKNEKTSKRVAKIAGRVMASLKAGEIANTISLLCTASGRVVLTVGDLKAICASVLTQAPDKPAKPKKAAVKK